MRPRLRLGLLAVWVPLSFTAPGDDRPYWPPYSGVVRYEAQCARAEGPWSEVALYSAPAAESVQVTPRAPGTLERIYVSQSASTTYRLAGGAQYRLRAVDAGGNASLWSNVVVVQVGCPDTLWALVRLMRDPGLRPGICGLPDGQKAWQFTSGTVSWALPLSDADTTRYAIWSGEQVQRWYLPGTCAIYHYWANRGTYQACDDTIGVLRLPAHAPGSPEPCPSHDPRGPDGCP
jgi:hypothetical protein